MHVIFCTNLVPRSGVDENSNLLGYNAVSIGKYSISDYFSLHFYIILQLFFAAF
jgi:hypothetical protein